MELPVLSSWVNFACILLCILTVGVTGDEDGVCRTHMGPKWNPPECCREEIEMMCEKWPQDNIQVSCCTPNSKAYLDRLRDVTDCIYTDCMPSPQSSLCGLGGYERIVNGKQMELDELMRESCQLDSGKPGVFGMCCPLNATQTLLEGEFGAEPHEFPHMAKFYGSGGCGGTIYNKRFILTAAHCVVDTDVGDVIPPDGHTLLVGTDMSASDDRAKQNTYNVKRFIAHPDYIKMKSSPNYNNPDQYFEMDIALVELEKDIKFGAHVKSLKIAPEGFVPIKYADTAILPGWGVTPVKGVIQMGGSWLLHKGDMTLISDDDCFKEKNSDFGYDPGYKGRNVFCAGGIVNGRWSQNAGSGSSGGPMICRGPDGRAVQCGIASMGKNDEICAEDPTKCGATVFTSVSGYQDWIERNAGPQDPTTFYNPFLYGEPVPEGKYGHQVHITSSGGKPCGGTLVSPGAVVTAAQCVINDQGESYAGIQITTGTNDLTKLGQQFGVSRVIPHPGFQRVGPPIDIAKQGAVVKLTDNYYQNDLAVIKLDGNVNISPGSLPQLPDTTPESGTELAFPRDNPNKFSQIRARDFRFLEKGQCQTRLNRLSSTGLNITADENVLCGVETYSGGSSCDRELGGGVICNGTDGQEMLCGVEIFRMCASSVPNGFINMALYKDWVSKNIA